MMHKRWLINNKDKMSEAKRRWRLANPEKCREQKRRARKRNPERINMLCRAWRARNKPTVKAINCNSLTRIRYKSKNLSSRDLSEKLLSANGVCEYCASTVERLSFDHKTPLSRGGKHTLKNIAIVCLSCNGRKQARTLSEFKKYCKSKGIKLIL